MAATILAFLLLLLVAVEFLRPRQEVSSVDSVASGEDARAQNSAINVPLPLTPERSLALTARLRPDEQLVADRSVQHDSPLLGIAIDGRKVTVTPLLRGTATPPPFSFRATAPVTYVQTGRLGTRRAVFSIGVAGAKTTVEARELRSGARHLGVWQAPKIAQLPGSHRDARLATWSGDTPDLFLIDRDPPTAMRVIVLSGESGFTDRLVATTVRVGTGFPREDWSLDVGAVAGHRPDIMLISSTERTPSGTTEVHVLDGARGFVRFLMQVRSTIPAQGASRASVLGRQGGDPFWFSVAEGTREVKAVKLRDAKPSTG